MTEPNLNGPFPTTNIVKWNWKLGSSEKNIEKHQIRTPGQPKFVTIQSANKKDRDKPFTQLKYTPQWADITVAEQQVHFSKTCHCHERKKMGL